MKHKARNTDFAKMRRIMARLEHQLAVEKEERSKKRFEKHAQGAKSEDKNE